MMMIVGTLSLFAGSVVETEVATADDNETVASPRTTSREDLH